MNSPKRSGVPPRGFFCSWSGGKDSCLALHRALQAKNRCAALFSLLDEIGKHSRSHGLLLETLAAQAKSIGIPLRTIKVSRRSCEEEYRNRLSLFRQENLYAGVFGDIDLAAHRDWIERVCREAGVDACFPLWKENRRELVCEFIRAGFKAIIVAVERQKMPERFLGQPVDMSTVGELERMGIDACGENGEFHTFVYDGPIFKSPLELVPGAFEKDDTYTYLPVSVGAL